MRLDKFMQLSSIGKRSEVRNFILDGEVVVNNSVCLKPSFEINEKLDRVEYLGKKVELLEKVYYMFHKPKGCITARTDEIHKTVFHYFNEEDKKGIFHVGRLDKDTEGLLLFTNDGDFEHRIMYPDKHVQKKYFFWALGSLNTEDIKRLEEGLYISKGKYLTKPAKIEIDKIGGYKEFKHEECLNEVLNIDYQKYNQPVVSGYLTISEGKKHQVKRMLKEVGCHVVYLKRISVGGVTLDQTLKKGEYRKLTEHEIGRVICDI